MEVLRLATAGSVDDGKSTLIGRLLLDTDSIFDDQLEAMQTVSKRKGDEVVNLALLTDGLKAEREQGITIDVAYRYFMTKRRKFILADCPGHFQYTRNMVTGMSGSNTALLLIDARQGLVEQARRHAFITSLLRVPHLVICVNKMDLVDFSEARFEEIRREFSQFSKKLEISDVTFIPISALEGDNVVEKSNRMPWYKGRSVLEQLEETHISSDENFIDFRFPVQMVIRPQSIDKTLHDYRGYAGRVLSGQIKVGDEVLALPSGIRSQISKIDHAGKDVSYADPLASVILQLQDDIDIARGDLLIRPNNWPTKMTEFEAIICWMSSEPWKPERKYLLKHTTKEVQCAIKELVYKFDIELLSRNFTNKVVGLNDIARVRIKTSETVFIDSYRQNRSTGSFILVDEQDFSTVAGGVIHDSESQIL